MTETLSSAEEEVVGALLTVSRVFVAVAARSLAGLDEDVTLPQFRALVVLVTRGPQRIVDLAQELAVTSSTATRMCNRLVAKGLVARVSRPEDRRAVWVTLTGPGRTLVGDVMRRRREQISALVAELSLTRPLGFAATLNALAEAAGEPTDAEWQRRWQGAQLHESSV
ncbi:MarR family winged helix-turn-helix transcriptional regulator [Paractinoplanes rhizophilus]|uniref:MarR family winged helix-turn-helix transcriptional regulator n=1 Tax=Paractinoplanes rhizophilus TaxID=1416877 RepID=A0ABW2HIK4_9ACTN|nr:MarR family transcriptional regulator [Actinoplanes sp.]